VHGATNLIVGVSERSEQKKIELLYAELSH